LRPRMGVLDRRRAVAIHAVALEILERVGVRVEHAGLLAALPARRARATVRS
jgi:trimethylamine:corrinoid methyltransferase-like protein